MSIIIDGTNGLSDVDGSAATPAIRGTDANTGIYFPGADRIGFATGGSQRGEFDASGNFQFNSGYGSVATAYGCRAWVNFNGTGTIAIRGSGNVTSITDNGVGDYTVNFTNAMPDANYSSLLTDGGPGVQSAVVADQTTARTTTALRMYALTSTGTLTDSAFISVAIFR